MAALHDVSTAEHLTAAAINMNEGYADAEHTERKMEQIFYDRLAVNTVSSRCRIKKVNNVCHVWAVTVVCLSPDTFISLLSLAAETLGLQPEGGLGKLP